MSPNKTTSRSLHPFLTGGARGWVVLFLLIFHLTSCDTYNCRLETKVQYVCGFYSSEGDGIAVGDTLTITALGIDSVLANRLVNQSAVKLPVSYYGDIDSLELRFTGKDGEGRDTVYIAKRNTAHLDGPSCPAHMWHTITQVYSTHHLIDTVLINIPDINYDGLENLQFRFRTAEE